MDTETMNISPYAIPGIIKTKAVTRERIIEVVCEYFGITEKILKKKCRDGNLIFPRFIAMYLIRFETGTEFTQIGIMFGKHHTTVIHACKSINDFISIKDRRTVHTLFELRKLLKQ